MPVLAIPPPAPPGAGLPLSTPEWLEPADARLPVMTSLLSASVPALASPPPGSPLVAAVKHETGAIGGHGVRPLTPPVIVTPLMVTSADDCTEKIWPCPAASM